MHFRIFKFCVLISVIFFSCNETPENTEKPVEKKDTTFNYIAEQFADVQLLNYRVDGFEELPLQQKKLAYFLYQAGLSGRDIYYDQKDKNGLAIRKTLEAILNTYSGDQHGEQWDQFLIYCQRFFFASGNHHHYSADKMIPGCSYDYFIYLLKNSDQNILPMNGMTNDQFLAFIKQQVFDPAYKPKLVDLTAKDVIKASSNNFYENVSQAEAEEFYSEQKKSQMGNQSQLGFNTKLIKENGKLKEHIWKSAGMYDAAIGKIIYWLRRAAEVSENDVQKETLEKLTAFYLNGNPISFDDYSISWVRDSVSNIDVVNGFIETYLDALQRKAAYESIVSMKDVQATKRISAISHEAQWFEDHSPIMDEYKKKKVQGISAKVITVISETGDAGPVSALGINLPNNEWIREKYGSKSVSLGNIIYSYNYYKSRSPMIDEFGSSDEVKHRVQKYGAIAGDLHVDMHEVIGHASGRIKDGVSPVEETLKNYSGTIEEARADLVALYYVMDKHLVDIGVMPSLEVGKAQYDLYILNGLMGQLQRIEPGKNLEEAHMRNRQMISLWAYKNGMKENVIEKIQRDGKTYFVIHDYEKLRVLFGKLLREIQRLKSEGDFAAAKNLIDTYGSKVDQQLLKEVRSRFEKLNLAPYVGFIQPRLVPMYTGDNITDVEIEYPESFIAQMLEYGKNYGFLPVRN